MVEFSIVIVSFNTCQLLMNCLHSIYSELNGIDTEIWVVDNASTDGSPEVIRQKFPQVNLIENHDNVGFACANNQALRLAKGQIFVLLNSDTLLQPGSLKSISLAFETNPKVGLVAPQLLNADGSIQPSWGKFSSAWTEFFFQFFLYKILPSPFPLGKKIHWLQRQSYYSAHPIEWATGACLTFRPEIIEKVGLLDESIFMYGEDMEWCWRIRKSGINILYWPHAKVIHLLNYASKSDYARWIVNYTKGQLGFIKAHRSIYSLRLAALMVIIGSILRIGAWTVMNIFRRNMGKTIQQRKEGYRKAIFLGWQVLIGAEL